jgi:hypothetical protein
MATNASELQKYFANMDAEEERVAEDIGISPDEVRFYEMQNVGKDMLPPSMMRPKELASPVPRAAVGLERAGRQLRSPVDMPETVPPLAMPSGMPAKPSDFASLQKLMSPGSLASPIPVAAAPVKADVPSAVKTAIPATTATQPAPPPDGSGGDDEMGRLSMGQALVRALEGSGSVISGQNLRSGAADTLGERMKQIEALRAKREEQSLEQQRERATWGASNRATLASALAQWKDDPEKKAALEALASGADTTKPGDFSRNTVNAVMTRPKVLGAEAGVGKTVAQTGVATAQAAAVPKKLEQGDKKLAETAAENLRRDAREWARMRAAADAAASKASAGQPEVVQKEVRATTQKLGDSVAKEYGEISSALKEADRSLEAIKNQPPDVFAKVMQATNLDGLNTAEERALFRSVGELRRAAQKAQSGLAVTENERAEFLQLFGANWLQSPSSLIEAIEWMRRKTKDKLDQSFATYRAQGSVGNTAVQAYREAGGVTPDAQFLLPFNERQPKTAAAPAPAPAAQVGGMTRMTGPDGKKYDVPNDKVAAAKAKGWKE